MKLYYTPGACSLASHIVLEELGLPYTAVAVDLQTKKAKDGRDFNTINPKGYVPALELDAGGVLSEGLAILSYLADRKPAAGLAPAAGTLERYRLLEWLAYIGTEVHKGFGPLFNPATSPEAKEAAKKQLGRRLGYADQALAKQDYLVGGSFTIADAYLWTVLSWKDWVGLDLSPWPNLVKYFERIAARPSVQAARAAEKAG